jgi:hypothetical protein
MNLLAKRNLSVAVCWMATCVVCVGAAASEPDLARDILPLLKVHCVKCHGPAKQEAGLALHTAAALARGGENGAIVDADGLDVSLLWRRIEADEMPPDEPLAAEQKETLRAWIAAGAKGLPAGDGAVTSEHWAFAPLQPSLASDPGDAPAADSPIDRMIAARRSAAGLAANPEADRATLIRRVAFDLTGLPPTPEERDQFLNDAAPGAYERMVERYLASPHYGERWGKYWLDAAGYADSNGYFSADSDRSLAYRYRDYVVRSFNDDKPFDRFVVEQLAGDELAGFTPESIVTPEMISLLEATHYLRNGQDGTGESDGNPDELRVDRYSALEATMQIVSSSLLGLTMQCARCHDHKFEPISQREYYQLQAVFYPALNVDDWIKPNERQRVANLPGVLEQWQERGRQIDGQVAALRDAFKQWAREHRPPSTVVFHDEFAEAGPALSDNWSNTAPGDDAAGGSPAVALESTTAPSAARQAGSLAIIEAGSQGDRWISTRHAFDWTPDVVGDWVQVTFDLVADRLDANGNGAERIAYFIALVDFNDNDPERRGNVLFDGRPSGGAVVDLDYPGSDSKRAGEIGQARYEAGHNYGVRITNIAEGKFRLEHLADGLPDDASLELTAADLPDGGFGFEYCCGRSFIVDNVLVEQSARDTGGQANGSDLAEAYRVKRGELNDAVKSLEQQRGESPGRIACVYERSATPPEVHLLARGDYKLPQEKVEPAPLAAISGSDDVLEIVPPADTTSSGRRLAWARWLTRPGGRPAALLARVQANRIWQHHFGQGIVATSENLGTSGATPSHPELLEYLATRLVDSDWSIRALHREILASDAYRQSSAWREDGFAADPENRLLWRYSLRRLDSEALRDAMLATSGELDRTMGGHYIPTERNADGEVVVQANAAGGLRRSLYLQQRRTQLVSFLNVFDTPSIVFNCVARPVSTIPTQSLSLLNSDFAVTCAASFARRVAAEAGEDPAARVTRAFVIAIGRSPTDAERDSSLAFVASQSAQYGADAADDRKLATDRAWADLCQMLLASNSFLYAE